VEETTALLSIQLNQYYQAKLSSPISTEMMMHQLQTEKYLYNKELVEALIPALTISPR
jgi:hypothetical protein